MECILTADTGSGESEQYKVAKSIENLIKSELSIILNKKIDSIQN